jgi:nitroimidazol reductase NimA-like FMN-containing flavoprotein (pyridoxamine 5'-phosphate oxidase superfamily)
VVPLNFGYTGENLYFHSASEGWKLNILGRNDRVCFLFDIDHQLVRGEQACDWGMRYRSVIGFGKAALVEDGDEKLLALAAIMEQYGEGECTFPDKVLAGTTVFKVNIEGMTGKQSGY